MPNEVMKSLMVTPGVKLPFDNDSMPADDDVDEDGDTQMVNEVSTKTTIDHCPI